ncbi:MAG: hypothetical protein CFE44_23320 [Burkholderiales bacterium PBB4]|nr:MAG: hypothetical protein CFE44_23320 [Burkholderiales bacterium PBB4]
MAAVDNEVLVRLRGLDAIEALDALAEHVKVDRSYEPTKSTSTQRVHVTAGGAEWELLLTGPKFYDTRLAVGGGGAIDLVMHIWRVPFKAAVAMLRRVHL